MTPHITAIYGAVLALWLVALALRISLLRKKHRVGMGAGGVADLQVAVRCHGNASEYIPIVILLLLLAELQGASALLLHIFGIAFVVGRILHAQGMTQSQGRTSFGRVVGTTATWLSMLALAIANLVLAVS